MKEVQRLASSSPNAITALLEKGTLYDKHSGEQIDAEELYPYLSSTPEETLRVLELLTTDSVSLAKKAIELAMAYAEQNRSLKESYSPAKSRLRLQQLALPFREKLLADDKNMSYSTELTQDIEAVYGNCVDELGFLLEVHDVLGPDDELRNHVEGSLTELTFFMLGAKNQSGLKGRDGFVIVPSDESQDKSNMKKGGIRTGFDFLIHRSDDVIIPYQVKTTSTINKEYDSSILTASLAKLTAVAGGTPRQLQEAMYLQLQGSRFADEALINRSHGQLNRQIMSYCPKKRASAS